MGNENCVLCDSIALVADPNEMWLNFVTCPVCGRYQYKVGYITKNINKDHFASYLVHNGFIDGDSEYRYFTTMDKEKCDEYSEKFLNGNNVKGHPIHLSVENVENWHPKTFSEKIDNILLYLDKVAKFVGNDISLKKEEAISAFFIERYYKSSLDNWEKRYDSDIYNQFEYILECLKNSEYIKYELGGFERKINLLPNGYFRIDSLQKNNDIGKNVFVAMQFGNETKKLREMIRSGIHDAGYVDKFIDEMQHNEFITPEILKQIKESVIVVVDLTHDNRGAYFEEGYAMGLGKPVIQLCQEGVELHFDIAQKNTIFWKAENEIPLKLSNRIKATI